MKRYLSASPFAFIGLGLLAIQCQTQAPQGSAISEIGVINGGPGFEDLDGQVIDASSEGAGDGASDSSTLEGSIADGAAGDGQDFLDAPFGLDSSASSSSSASGSSGSSTSSSSSSGAGSSTEDAGDGGITDAADASSGSVTLTLTGLTLTSLDWTIQGPNTYSGTIEVGDAQTFEWVIGGVQAGDGYTITIAAIDTNGDPCQGTSPPFNVRAGVVNTTTLAISCSASSGASTNAADVTTGSLAVQIEVVDP
jgi:hypothetical protein